MEINPTEYLKPRIVDVDIVSPQRAKVVLEPMERGFGFTLGNSIRRVLLSSIPGFAITQVKIDGVVITDYEMVGLDNETIELNAGESENVEVKYTTTGLSNNHIKHGVMQLVSSYYDNRSDFITGESVNEVPSNVKNILSSLKSMYVWKNFKPENLIKELT